MWIGGKTKHYKKYERVALETRNLMYKSLIHVYLRQFYQFSENRIPETTTWNRNTNNNIIILSIYPSIVNTANHSSPRHRAPKTHYLRVIMFQLWKSSSPTKSEVGLACFKLNRVALVWRCGAGLKLGGRLKFGQYRLFEYFQHHTF